MPARALRITRFTVMATLQAARARRLGLPEPSAFSWGLNRAIFYAAAKQGFGSPGGRSATGEPTPGTTPSGMYRLGDDFAYRTPEGSELRFTIGGEVQTEAEFRRQVAARFGSDQNFAAAWREAEALIAKFDDAALKSGRRFYSEVYKPRRDDLVAQWNERYLHGQPVPSSPPRRAGRPGA